MDACQVEFDTSTLLGDCMRVINCVYTFMKNLFLMFGLALAIGAASLAAANKTDSTTIPTACTNAAPILCTNSVPLACTNGAPTSCTNAFAIACTNGVPIACTNGVFQFSSIDLTSCTNCLAAN